MRYRFRHVMFLLALMVMIPAASQGNVIVQCPGDVNGDAVPDPLVNGLPNPAYNANVRCAHLTAGDGYVKMGDGTPMYIFGFSNVTGVASDQVMAAGYLAANFAAPTLSVDEGDQLYLTLTNVGMANRPDLFDPHSVHFHGFPQASAIFDGEPESTIGVNQGSSFTYFYNLVEPGTYMYHCHVEAAEHMQMGMLGNLYVRPKQNKLADLTLLNGFTHHTGFKYAYNDGDGSTYYDVEYPIQISSFDPTFHNSSQAIQPLPFYLMNDTYAMLNGRGYPDTINPNPLAPPADNGGKVSQPVSSLIEATQGQKILLRLSNLSITRLFTLGTTGLPMKVVGVDARHLRSVSGQNLYYSTNSLTLGGGESVDVIIDTTAVPPGSYFLYTTNLQYLSNNTEEHGGMMSEIVIKPVI